MRRTEILQETRKMRFAEVYSRWAERRLTQEQAAEILGVCDRTFRRYMDRYDEEGVGGLLDKRLIQASSRRAPVYEVLEVARQYERYRGWSVRHFYGKYRESLGNGVTRGLRTVFNCKGWFLKPPSGVCIGSVGSEPSYPG